MLREIEKIPKKVINKIDWTEEKKAILLKYWKCRRQQDIAKLLNVSPRACADKYNELIKESVDKL